MCGILGFAGEVPNAELHSQIRDGLSRLQHRGPDQEGSWISNNGCIGLGHTRLSIQDISALGNQPMVDPLTGTVLVFNGEIYNFKRLRSKLEAKGCHFKSRGDTEVVLLAYRKWGIEFVKQLNGMFALAIYDPKEQHIYLVRDRAGEKPLFYSVSNTTISFASELKALFASNKKSLQIEAESLDSYLTMGFVPGDGCLVKGYSKLPPASILKFDLATKTADIYRYWELPSFTGVGPGASSKEELLENLELLLEESVANQLVSDVPVGVLLSGGTDSSLITAMAARAHSRIKTFTVKFMDDKSYDESPHAEAIASYFGTDHKVLECGSLHAQNFHDLARQFDEPIIDSSMIPTAMLSSMVRNECTVALGGDGGDELFGGYNHYSRLITLGRLKRFFPSRLGPIVNAIANKYLPAGSRGKNWLSALNEDLKAHPPLIARYFTPHERSQLMKGQNQWNCYGEINFIRHSKNGRDILERATRTDFENYLPQDILAKVDRASMLSSIEVRAPLLDTNIIEFAFSKVPSEMKTNTRERKILLKALAKKVLPDGFDANRKQGFDIPLDKWFSAGEGKKLLEEYLLDTGCIFDEVYVRKLLDLADRGYGLSERLFGLLIIELWRAEYNIQL